MSIAGLLTAVRDVTSRLSNLQELMLNNDDKSFALLLLIVSALAGLTAYLAKLNWTLKRRFERQDAQLREVEKASEMIEMNFPRPRDVARLPQASMGFVRIGNTNLVQRCTLDAAGRPVAVFGEPTVVERYEQRGDIPEMSFGQSIVSEVPKALRNQVRFLNGEGTLIGQGFRADDRIVTALHVWEHSSVITTGTDLYVDLDKYAEDEVICPEMDVMSFRLSLPAFSRLQIKDSKLGTLQISTSASIVTSQGEGVYRRTAMVLERDTSGNRPFIVKHKVDTVPGDSGAPVYQNGRLVGVHIGCHNGGPDNSFNKVLCLNPFFGTRLLPKKNEAFSTGSETKERHDAYSEEDPDELIRRGARKVKGFDGDDEVYVVDEKRGKYGRIEEERANKMLGAAGLKYRKGDNSQVASTSGTQYGPMPRVPRMVGEGKHWASDSDDNEMFVPMMAKVPDFRTAPEVPGARPGKHTSVNMSRGEESGHPTQVLRPLLSRSTLSSQASKPNGGALVHRKGLGEGLTKPVWNEPKRFGLSLMTLSSLPKLPDLQLEQPISKPANQDATGQPSLSRSAKRRLKKSLANSKAGVGLPVQN